MNEPLMIPQYAVRVKGTHRYLPRPQRADGRGGSHMEPMDFSDIENMPVKDRYRRNMMIRTFTTKQAAQNLLSSWLQGKFRADWDYEDGYSYTVGPLFIEGSSREHMREHMEIVELMLVLPPI